MCAPPRGLTAALGSCSLRSSTACAAPLAAVHSSMPTSEPPAVLAKRRSSGLLVRMPGSLPRAHATSRPRASPRFRRFHRLRASLPSQLVRRRHLHPCDPRCRRREIFRRGPSVIFRPGSRCHRDAPPRLAHFTQGGPERTLEGSCVRAHVSARTCDGRRLWPSTPASEPVARPRGRYGERDLDLAARRSPRSARAASRVRIRVPWDGRRVCDGTFIAREVDEGVRIGEGVGDEDEIDAARGERGAGDVGDRREQEADRAAARRRVARGRRTRRPGAATAASGKAAVTPSGSWCARRDPCVAAAATTRSLKWSPGPRVRVRSGAVVTEATPRATTNSAPAPAPITSPAVATSGRRRSSPASRSPPATRARARPSPPVEHRGSGSPLRRPRTGRSSFTAFTDAVSRGDR